MMTPVTASDTQLKGNKHTDIQGEAVIIQCCLIQAPISNTEIIQCDLQIKKLFCFEMFY